MSKVSQKILDLKSTFIDTRIINAKEININGESIEDKLGLQLPKDYSKLMSRCDLPEDKNWALWGDDGNLIYMNFSDKIINGEYMFCDMSQLKSFNCDLSSLEIGDSMFEYCKNLTDFKGDISSLTSGSYMFSGCRLNKSSVIHIINNLKEKNTYSSSASITLGIDGTLIADEELLTFLGISEGDNYVTITGKGGGVWDVELEWNNIGDR